MKIYLNIEADSTAEILEAFKELAATGATVQVKPAETKKRKPAAPQTPETDPVVEDAPPTEVTPPAEEDAPVVEIPSIEDIKKVAVEKGKTPEGKAAIKKLLTSFESPSISAIPEEKRAAFLAALEEI